MNPLKTLKALNLRQQMTVAGATLLSLLLIFTIATQVAKPSMSLLYADLDPATAGEVIGRLDTLDVAYRVDGGAIYTDSTRRDSLRLELAREGLPRQDVVGYELFDDLNSFAMSSDMFDAAWMRAKEGELVRTLISMPDVQAARVHLGMSKARSFSRNAESPTASVTLSTARRIDASRVQAIQHVVALAVSGLSPEDVAVIDARNGLLSGEDMPGASGNADGMPGQRAANMKAEILRLVEARVGRGNARVNVNLDINTTHETITERSYDPEGRVLRSQKTTESTDTSSGENGSVTIASNLPEGAAGGGNSQAERSEVTDETDYAVSEKLVNREIMPGSIRRLSVAVLVDQVGTADDDGNLNWTERSQAELETIRNLVMAASGMDAARGDTVTVESLPFNRPAPSELVQAPGFVATFLDRHLWSLIQLIVLSVILLGLARWIIKPLLTPMEQADDVYGGALDPMALPSGGDLGGMSGLPSPNGGTLGMMGNGDMPMMSNNDLGMMGDSDNFLQAPDPLTLLNDTARDHQEETTDLLATLLNPEEEVVT